MAPAKSSRAEPGTKQTGDYFRIIVRPKSEFVTFRNHDVGDVGGLQRLAGKRQSGSWDTHAWLVSKNDAHMEGDKLVPDSNDAKDLFDSFTAPMKHKKGDVFITKD